MSTYNIHPLALSPQHYLLARAGFVMAPLRVEEVEEAISIALEGVSRNIDCILTEGFLLSSDTALIAPTDLIGTFDEQDETILWEWNHEP